MLHGIPTAGVWARSRGSREAFTLVAHLCAHELCVLHSSTAPRLDPLRCRGSSRCWRRIASRAAPLAQGSRGRRHQSSVLQISKSVVLFAILNGKPKYSLGFEHPARNRTCVSGIKKPRPGINGGISPELKLIHIELPLSTILQLP